MPGDRALGALLRALQFQGQQDASRLLGTAASLLITLNNPLNVALLVNRMLSSSALWHDAEGLRFALSFMGVFHSALARVVQREVEHLERKTSSNRRPHLPAEPIISAPRWINAVLDGVDESSPWSRHLLVLGGLLIGLASHDDHVIPRTKLASMQESFVKTSNSALLQRDEHVLGHAAVVLAINHTFPYLSDFEQTQLDCNELLPLLVNSLLASPDGLQSGHFLGAIDQDVRQSAENQFNWPASTATYRRVISISSSPLVSSMGSLSRLIAHAVEHVQDSWLVSSVVDEVAEFARTLYKQWRLNKLSEIDVAEENMYLHEEALIRTLPDLWRLLRNSMFALVIMLRSAIGRLLADRALARDSLAPNMASHALHALRHLNFIFARLGTAAFSQYTFVHLTCIDLLNAYPRAALTLLRSMGPAQHAATTIPAHPLDRTLDLFFLNTAEHFTLVTPPEEAETLLIAAATPYLTSTPTPELRPSLEAAHALMLAIFAAPQNAVDLTRRHLPSYLETLFRVFPQNLSARQFRLAMRNLLGVVSPPSRTAETQPLLAAVLLDLLRERALHAPSFSSSSSSSSPSPSSSSSSSSPSSSPSPSPSPSPLLPSSFSSQLASSSPPRQRQSTDQEGAGVDPPLSEQAVFILALIDALPFVEVALVEEWLPLLPELLGCMGDGDMRDECVIHLWETMTSGVMDPERSQVCVAWWTSRGGMEAVHLQARNQLHQHQHQHQRARTAEEEMEGKFTMAGGLPTPPASKL